MPLARDERLRSERDSALEFRADSPTKNS